MFVARILSTILMCLVSGCVTRGVDTIAQRWQQSRTAFTSAKPTQNPSREGYKLSPPLLARLVYAAKHAETNIKPCDINLDPPIYVYAYDENGKKVGFLRSTGNGMDLCFEQPGMRPNDPPLHAVVRDPLLVGMLVNEHTELENSCRSLFK